MTFDPPPPQASPLRVLLLRPLVLPALVLLTLLLLALLLLVARSWQHLQRLQPLDQHAVELRLLQDINLNLQVTLLESLDRRTLVGRSYVTLLRGQVEEVLTLGSHLQPDTPRRLRQLNAMLERLEGQPSMTLSQPLDEIRQVIAAETLAHNQLLQQARRYGRGELWVAVAVALLLPLLAGASLYFLRKRIWTPLQDLGRFMSLLAHSGYEKIPARNVDLLLAPLFHRYNQMVDRLETLERQSRARQATLEDDVRTATRTLMAYQRELAGAERLAAIGEVAAGLAHDLRNPLAGVRMALANLRGELTDPEHVQRLELVIDELKRVTRSLNDLLDRARQAPEPLMELELAGTLAAVLSLARYQVPEGIRLESAAPEGWRCRLPENRLRQALLNLIVNAAQSIGEGPGTIRVEAASINDRLRLTVADDGPGFPEAFLQGGGRPFVTLKAQGTGLGLAMVRRFVHDLGGVLNLANRQPRGALVTLELPCTP